MPNGKIFAAEFTLRRNVSALDKLLIEDSEDGVVKYAYPPQVSALSGYAYAESIADLPDNPANKTIAYVVGRMLYIYVGEGGDAKNGEYQSVDFLVGPQGIPGEKGDKGDPGDGSIDEAYLANYLQQNQYQTAADVNSKLALYATKQYVQDEISELLGGASSAFDTLKEIEDVLAGNVDSIGDLFAVLDTKWTQDNTLIAHWNEAYSWGNHALAGYLTQADASDFVTVTEAQTITGAKNFTGGLQVNGSAIVYNSALGVWQLTGDLLVTGGISMYSSIEGFVPSTITDAVLIDNQTIKRNSLGALYAVAAGLDESQLAAYLTTNNYAKKSDITTALVPYALASAIPTNNNQLTNGAGYITSSALNGYAKLTDIPSLADYATETFVNTAVNGAKEWVEEQQYLTGITSGDIESILGYQPYDGDTNRLGFLTSSALNGYATQSWVNTALAGYLSKNGGQIVGEFAIKAGATNSATIRFRPDDGAINHWLGVDKTGKLWFSNNGWSQQWDILHSGNYSDYALPKDGTAASATKLATAINLWGLSFDGTKNITSIPTFPSAIDLNRDPNTGEVVNANKLGFEIEAYSTHVAFKTYGSYSNVAHLSLLYNSNVAIGGNTADAKLHVHGDVKANSFIGNLSGNASSATKLETPRTIWGQSFDGTGNVSGALSLYPQTQAANASSGVLRFHSDSTLLSGPSIQGVHAQQGYGAKHLVFYQHNTGGYTEYEAMRLTYDGNLVIGGTTASAKLHVYGDAIIDTLHITTNEINGVNGTGNAHINYSSTGKVTIANGGGNVAIGGTAASAKLHVHGNLLTTGGITMYSQRSLKNILSYEGLSLEELSVIKPIKFTWKDGRDNRYHVGGVADDVGTVVPEVVYSANDFLTMDYGNAGFYVAASLIKPVLDHEQRIKFLEQENKTLREEINQLRQSA